ncbi:IgA Peptidase M64 [soil metagenome]
MDSRLTRILSLLLLLNIAAARAEQPKGYNDWFTDRTMRVDYFHTGTATEEVLALDRVVADGPWPGSRTRLIDDLNLGKYLVEVRDRETNRVLWSRGFATIYGEWETTDEAKQMHRTFHESVWFPWPRKPVQVVLSKRDRENAFQQIWSIAIDPDSRFVDAADREPMGKVWSLLESGPPPEKVDLLLIAEGYTAEEMPKFRRDAERLTAKLFELEPFKSRRSDFNVRALELPAARSGVNRPHVAEFRRTPLSTTYNIFDSERYLLTYDNRAFREAASAAPYEFVEILVNEKQYGGGGIHNWQATTSVDTGFAEYVFVHEFAHHFAGLADEYYTSPVAYNTDAGGAEQVEPWEANATALRDPAKLKWRDLVTAGTPIPTPWEKEKFEKQSRAFQERRRKLLAERVDEKVIDDLFREQQKAETKLLDAMEHAGKVGAFEGANYQAEGLYRPEADCIMFTRNEVGFCRVCQRAMSQVIDQYSRP